MENPRLSHFSARSFLLGDQSSNIWHACSVRDDIAVGCCLSQANERLALGLPENRSIISLREALRQTTGMTPTRKEDIRSHRMPPRSVLRPHAQTNHGCRSVVSMLLAVPFLLLGAWPLGRKTASERAAPANKAERAIAVHTCTLVLIGLRAVHEVLGALLSLDF